MHGGRCLRQQAPLLDHNQAPLCMPPPPPPPVRVRRCRLFLTPRPTTTPHHHHPSPPPTSAELALERLSLPRLVGLDLSASNLGGWEPRRAALPAVSGMHRALPAI